MAGASWSLASFAILVSLGAGLKVDPFLLVSKFFQEEAVFGKN